MEKEYPLEVEWIPFELHPGTPEDGLLLAERFGSKNFKVKLDDLKERGQRFGYEYAGMERMANSHNALLAEFYGLQQQHGESFRNEIYHAYFEEGRNIGQIDVLLDIGEKAGMNRQELQAFIRETNNEIFKPCLKLIEKFEVNSVPTFIVADRYKVVGSDQEEALRRVIEKAMKE